MYNKILVLHKNIVKIVTVWVYCCEKKINKLEKKYAPALDNYGQKVILLGVIFLKWSVSDHKKEMKATYLSFCEYLTNPNSALDI